eukprot:TRINITY_DN11651_c0_g1_i3.p1 TRINITY_DN11651_c0_g1~~TRINITY_DN11651_c0_g1_i3.p1  ORF type:complete len:543 (-),score=56.06 TRINITY_DN11651_c0_g1_i3:288-1811(-)
MARLRGLLIFLHLWSALNFRRPSSYVLGPSENDGVFRVLYLCHRPQDGKGKGGFTYQDSSSVTGTQSVGANKINDAFILTSNPVGHSVEYSFMDPAFKEGFKPIQLASWDRWIEKYGPPSEAEAIGGCTNWLLITGKLSSKCRQIASPIPSGTAAIAVVAESLCRGQKPCYDAVVSVACPGFLEQDIVALNREIMLPGADYYQGNGNPCAPAVGFTSAAVSAPFDEHGQICKQTRMEEKAQEREKDSEEVADLRLAEDAEVFRVLYLCHRPQDGAGVGGFTYEDASNISGLQTVGADKIEKEFILTSNSKRHPVEHSFMDPALTPGFLPMRLASWDEWIEKYGDGPPEEAVGSCGRWLQGPGNLSSTCRSVASPIPENAHTRAAVAQTLCRGQSPCYDVVVSVACPGFLEQDILALNREVMLPGADYYQGNGNPCEATVGFTSAVVDARFAENAKICKFTRRKEKAHKSATDSEDVADLRLAEDTQKYEPGAVGSDVSEKPTSTGTC